MLSETVINMERLVNGHIQTEAWLTKIEISESLKSILDSMGDAVIIVDEQQHCLFFNPTATKLFGNSSSGILTEEWLQSFEFYQSDRTTPFSLDEIPLVRAIQGEEIEDIEIFVRSSHTSKSFWIKLTGRPLQNKDGIKKGSIIICRDITKSKQIEEKLRQSAYHDELTGLPNRTLFLENVGYAIDVVREREDYKFAVLFLDLDRFKIINDSLGRMIGDQLLFSISERLKTCLRGGDMIARLGGDEFAILLKNVQGIQCTIQIAERIYQKLLQPFDLDGDEIFINLSIGIALSHLNYQKPENILRDADIAMSYAKKQGRSHYQVFSQDMHTQAVSLLKLENDLRRAIERQELQVHYQPIVSLPTKRIIGFEALVRWQHPERGFVSPADFIPVAEETGLIIPLGIGVLKDACHQMAQWQSQFSHATNWTMNVNISGKQLSHPKFKQQIKEILQDTRLSPHCLKLEITESILVENAEIASNTLAYLQGLGVQFSLDDFGTGYSSLSYLHQFPFNTLKIDRSFINCIDSCSEKLGIIRAIVSLARNLGMDVIAEGIETANHLAQLKVLKCQYGQGYFFSKALDSQGAQALIERELIELGNTVEEDPKALLEEQLSKEKLMYHIEHLCQDLEELKREKIDLEIMLETTTEHADMIESQLHLEIKERQKAQINLQQVNQKLEKLTMLDSLTQVANRRRFDEYLLQQWQHLRDENLPMSLILCDVDYFKLYNDTYGHQVGDHCLRQVALAISHTVKRSSDLVARYGGEEFAVILPNTDAQQALQLAERICAKVKDLKIPHSRSSISEYVTMSLGVFGMVPAQEGSPELLITLTDKALYEAKTRGRDRAVLAFS